MTSIELRQKLINQIDRLSFEKLLVVEKLIESRPPAKIGTDYVK